MTKIYRFDELHPQVQNDILVQFENCFDEDSFAPEDCEYQLTMLSYGNILEILDNIFGPNLTEAIYFDEYVTQLAEDIDQNGLRFPPIGNEGIHRMLAFALLKKDMPYYKIAYPTTEGA
ncbi:MAG: hypothetical protein L0Z48_01925 [candidate division Zixibacteria bacterium]|nr:hypothetical protein [candidate division Zixibacteria bacterium]